LYFYKRMRYPFLFLAALLIAVAQTSCKKDPIVQTIHSDTTITGNQAPNYTGVPTLSIQLYVNKLYVDLLGREPNATELQTHTNSLITQNLSAAVRSQIVEQLLADSLYFGRLFDLTSADCTNGVGRTQINDMINLYTYVAYLDSLNGNTQYLFYYYYEIDRLTKLKTAGKDLFMNLIDINEFYRRFLDNYFYDQVNMGSENFVKAAFDDLFRRPPTEAELASGILMVDGGASSILLVDGSSKANFMEIVTHADAFYEGLARKTYLQMLLREPDSQELASAIILIKPAGDFKALQTQILISNEYAGF
jgi:hypothetical protein